jgi:hypothetical protein
MAANGIAMQTLYNLLLHILVRTQPHLVLKLDQAVDQRIIGYRMASYREFSEKIQCLRVLRVS